MERNNPVAEMNKHLQMFRATPHTSTGYPPAQLLFGRNINTRLPHPREEENALVEKALVNDAQAKATQKKYKDAKPYVKHHKMSIGDQVLLKQHQSKRNPPYDPEPYTVVDINGHQVTADRADQPIVTRDAQKWKPINMYAKSLTTRERMYRTAQETIKTLFNQQMRGNQRAQCRLNQPHRSATAMQVNWWSESNGSVQDPRKAKSRLDMV